VARAADAARATNHCPWAAATGRRPREPKKCKDSNKLDALPFRQTTPMWWLRATYALFVGPLSILDLNYPSRIMLLL
jgi:hypothetical protein